VPFGPRARIEEASEDDAQGAGAPVGDQPDRSASTETHEFPARPGLVAEDFWGGLAGAGDLIQFPAEPAVAAASTNRRRPPVRLAAAGAAVICVAVIGVRAWAGSGGGSLDVRGVLAKAANSISNVPLTEPAVGPPRPHHAVVHGGAAARPRYRAARASTHTAHQTSRPVLVKDAGVSSGPSQPVVYSTPPPTQPTAPPSGGAGGGGGRGGSGGGGSGGGGSGGGGRAHGSAARSAGPRGPRAAFGPGKIGG
jgi:uncharacterized membrane protein YgcG